MKISALEEYGLRCLVRLARKNSAMPMTLPEIAIAEGLSLAYAGKIMAFLRKAGLAKSVRGRQGGYVLKRPPDQMLFSNILGALGKPLYGERPRGTRSGEFGKSSRKKDGDIQGIWKELSQMIDIATEKMTLADLASGEYSFNKNGPDLKR